jgi:hypothetical protein
VGFTVSGRVALWLMRLGLWLWSRDFVVHVGVIVFPAMQYVGSNPQVKHSAPTSSIVDHASKGGRSGVTKCLCIKSPAARDFTRDLNQVYFLHFCIISCAHWRVPNTISSFLVGFFLQWLEVRNDGACDYIDAPPPEQVAPDS